MYWKIVCQDCNLVDDSTKSRDKANLYKQLHINDKQFENHNVKIYQVLETGD